MALPQKHRAVTVLQAAVRQRVMLRLVFARADQAWAATAARIDGCRHPPVLLPAHHRDDAKGKRDGAEKHEHAEISTGVSVIEGSDGDLFLSFSCSGCLYRPGADGKNDVPLTDVAGDVSAISATHVEFAESERRVQRLVELAACDESVGCLPDAVEPRSLGSRRDCAQANVEAMLCFESRADQCEGRAEVDREEGTCEELAVDWQNTSISDFSSSLTSTGLSLSAVWDHEGPLSSTAVSVRSHQQPESFCEATGSSDRKDEKQEGWNNSAETAAQEKDGLSGFCGEEERGQMSSPTAAPQAATNDSSRSAAAALSQNNTPHRTLEDKMDRADELEEGRHAAHEGGMHEALEASSGALDSSQARQDLLKEQRRMLLERELRWAREALVSRKKHLKNSRLVGGKETSVS